MLNWIILLFLTGCGTFTYANGDAVLSSSSGPYFTLYCTELQGCFKYAGRHCNGYYYRNIYKTKLKNKYEAEFICEVTK